MKNNNLATHIFAFNAKIVLFCYIDNRYIVLKMAFF